MIRTIRIRNGKATIRDDAGTLLSVEVDPRANGRLVTFDGEFAPIEDTDFVDSQGNTRMRASFTGKATLVPFTSVTGLGSTRGDRTSSDVV